MPPIDHTKYIGKSIGHQVSPTIFLIPQHLMLAQDNVKFSEDGEQVVEGVDKSEASVQ